MVSVAALTGWGAVKTSSRAFKSSPAGVTRMAPLAETNLTPAVTFSIPEMPELKFSNKFSSVPLPKIEHPEYYLSGKFDDNEDRRKYNPLECSRFRYNEITRAVSPYIPDIFYEKSKLPYPERQAFLNSPEKRAITEALEKQFKNTAGEIFNHEPLMPYILRWCDQVLIYGRPVASLPTETESVRKAVDLCGLKQLGYWMDIHKAKMQGEEPKIPADYDAVEAEHQQKYASPFKYIYRGSLYRKAIGVLPEKPIRSYCPFFTEADFAHLSPPQKEELLQNFRAMPPMIVGVQDLYPLQIYEMYQEIKADKTGYTYVLNNGARRNVTSKERAMKTQKLCLEMLIYKRPLALLRAENYSLERIIFICKFKQVDEYCQRKAEGKKPKRITQIGRVLYNMEANAMVTLGKRYHHPDWVQLGQEMYAEGKEAGVCIESQNPPLTQNRAALKSNKTRIRDQ